MTAALQLLLLLLWMPAVQRSSAADTNSPLFAWLGRQAEIQTWSADFVQTRTLKSLLQPLTATGHVWFAAPNRFRWELGQPPQTIALRQTNELYVVYPRLKRAERYALTGSANQWRDTLALLDAGFPRSETELESRFRLLSLTNRDDQVEIDLQPRSAAARQFMPQIKIVFAAKSQALLATELQSADGSTLRNDFTNAVLNPVLDESLFTPDIGGDFKVIEPLKDTR